MPAAKAAVPAALGGTPIRTAPFPAWPQIDDRDRKQWKQVLEEKAWCELKGTQVKNFEKEYERRMKEGHCIAFANGTSALLACLFALGIEPGDEVLLPARTFVASMQPILNLLALPVFVDTDPETGQIDPAAVEACITARTKAIMPVHLGGASVDLDRILAIARKHGLKVVEDACQAPGTEWEGRHVGLFGDCGALSFQVSKTLPCGEGGAVLTTSDKIRTLVQAFRNNGRDPEKKIDNYPYFGLNFRMTEFQGALLLTQLDKFEEQSRRRRENAALLDKGFSEIPGLKPVKLYSKNTRHNYYHYDALYDVEGFDGLPLGKFVSAMKAEGIPISGGGDGDLLPDSPSIDLMLQRTGFRKLFGANRLQSYQECRRCPNARAYGTIKFGFQQQILLGSRSDMEDILNAARKIWEHARELKA